MNRFLEKKTDIQNLLDRYKKLYGWVSDNPLADIRLFEDKANQLAILSVRISNYNKNNLK